MCLRSKKIAGEENKIGKSRDATMATLPFCLPAPKNRARSKKEKIELGKGSGRPLKIPLNFDHKWVCAAPRNKKKVGPLPVSHKERKECDLLRRDKGN